VETTKALRTDLWTRNQLWDTVIDEKGEPRMMMYEELLKERSSRRDVGHRKKCNNNIGEA
jgi:hypothetical protein